MRETREDLTRLQSAIDRSFDASGSHLSSIFGEEHRLDARELVAALEGIFEMHLAAVTSSGAPLVAPVDGIFFRGKVWFGLPADAVRARLVRLDPRVSASYSCGSFAFILHGSAHEVDDADPRWPEYEAAMRELYVAQYGVGWIDWYEQMREHTTGQGFTGYIEPRVLFAKR